MAENWLFSPDAEWLNPPDANSIGKFAPFACSSLRTVFYSTSDVDGCTASQGVTRLTSFKTKHGNITQGTGFFGNDKNTPMYNQLSVDPAFTRDKDDTGTDLYVIGFTGDDDWKNKLIASVLDGFLYAVYSGSLIVGVDGVEISSKTLPQLMIDYKGDFEEHADEYYQALTDSEKNRIFTKEITDEEVSGNLTLNLVITPGYGRRVAMIRQTGMKIKDKGNINGLIPFAGTLYIEGEKLNAFLRSLENPQHLEWEIERAEEKKGMAKRLLATLTKFIKESLNEMIKQDNDDVIDPTVGEFLSAEDFEKSENEERSEAIKDTISDFKVRIVNVAPKQSGNPAEGEMMPVPSGENGEIDTYDVPGEGEIVPKYHDINDSDDPTDEPSDEPWHEGEGPEQSETPGIHKNTLSSISASSIRNFVTDKEKGKYTVLFTPNYDAENGFMDVVMVAESQGYAAPIISAFVDGNKCTTVTTNRVSSLSFIAGKTMRIELQLDYQDYCSLEVRAYGIKK